jgi:chromosome segregation ATPase
MSKDQIPEGDVPLSVIQDELRKGLRVFRAFEKAEETINALAAADHRLAHLNVSITRQQEALTAVTVQLDEATLARESAKAAVKRLLAETGTEREQVMAKANEQAAQIVADAKDKADALTKKAVQKAEAAEERANAAEARERAAAAELAEIESKLDAAKAQIAKLLG